MTYAKQIIKKNKLPNNIPYRSDCISTTKLMRKIA